ncbi:MAG: patatin-like phospholipase family protein [Candidatus Sedimenticola sp. (ex Thyasira tokunagai)]
MSHTFPPLFLLFLLLTGCASTARFPDNPALDGAIVPEARPGFAEKDNGDILLLLSFSGGGSRASALAYGVLEQLHLTPIRSGDQNLLDEVDMISAVSGGSITAAYFGLYGDRLFRDFKKGFLERDVSRELKSTLLSPSSLSRLSSDTFGSGDLLDEYLRKRLFGDASLSQLLDSEGPYIQINATDLFKGGRFSFTSGQFALICSDTQGFPIARAVAASSAIPLIFTPITLTNRANSCGYTTPEWIQQAAHQKEPNSRRSRAANYMKSYLDREKHPYIHLLDGGLTDNLGLRAIIDRIEVEEGMWNTLQQFNQEQVKHIVLITVDASATTPSKWELSAATPPVEAVLDAATTAPLENYNFETLEYLRNNLPKWLEEMQQAGCQSSDDCKGTELYFIELHLDEVADPVVRARLTSVRTDFSLPQGIPIQLIDAGKELLRLHPEYRRLLQNTGVGND